MNSVANSPTERSLLLRSYFEPTDDERRSGLKVPTAAHRTMAQLTLSGHVHLFLTTIFDRLLENALNDVGIVPQVLSTPEELEVYDPATNSLLDVEATQRYKNALALPRADWARMVCDDGDAFCARAWTN